MIKTILSITFFTVLLAGIPTVARANQAIEIIDNAADGVTISVSQSTLHVSGASGQMLYVYNLAGVRVMSIKVDSSDKRYELNLSKGCYIVKVGNTVRKISIR